MGFTSHLLFPRLMVSLLLPVRLSSTHLLCKHVPFRGYFPYRINFFLNFTYRLDIRLSRFCIFTPLLQSALLSSYLNYCHHFESYDLPSLRHLHLRIYFYAHLTHHLLRLPL